MAVGVGAGGMTGGDVGATAEAEGVGVAVGVNLGSRTEIPPEEATRQLTVIQPSAAIALGTNKAGRPGVYKFLISSLSSLLGKNIKL